ncbi:HYDIN protein, partial [Atrichornis clamosus]|nr:HYDIN protein [Atrichornis clamosus]
PCSSGVDATVVVKNPCEFPIEFYSLDFDRQYLEEEKILRMVRRNKSPKPFLMPPRAAGETLPPEVLEYYEARKKQKAQQAEAKARAEAEAKARAEAEAKAKAKGKAAPAARRKSITSKPEPMVEVIESPVSRALTRYLGTDTPAEGQEALELRGVVVIVHGAPLAGKTATAAALGKYYGALCLSIDTVVKEAITNN